MNTGEWLVMRSKNGCSNRFKNSNITSKATTPKNWVTFVLVIWRQLRAKNKMMNVMMPKPSNAY